MTVIYHQHQMSGHDRAGATLVAAACSAHTHVHGGHDRVVPNDPECCAGTVSPPSFRRGVYYPSLKLGGAFIRPVLSIPLRLRVASPAVSSRGRTVFVSLPTSIVRHKFLPALRCQSCFRKQPANFTVLCICKSVQDRADALHHPFVLSSAVEPSKGQHAAKVFGNVRKAVGKIRNV